MTSTSPAPSGLSFSWPPPVRRWVGAACLAGLGWLLTGCDGRPPEVAVTAGPPVLARVGDATLDADDLQREVDRRRAARRPVPSKEALVREMAENLALARHALALGLDREPAIALEIQALTVRRLLERELAPRLAAIEPTPEQVEAEYRQTLSKHTLPARDRLALLFLDAPEKASPARRAEARQRLEEARRRFLDRKDPAGSAGGGTPIGTVSEDFVPGFGPMAVEFSDDQGSRYRGGDIGWLESGNVTYRWPRAVLEAGYALAVGAMSDVIETDAGPYLVLKTDSRPAVVRPFSEVASSIHQALRAEQRRAADEAYRREVAERIGVSIDAAALAAVTPPEPSPRQIAQRAEAPPPSLSSHESPGR